MKKKLIPIINMKKHLNKNEKNLKNNKYFSNIKINV